MLGLLGVAGYFVYKEFFEKAQSSQRFFLLPDGRKIPLEEAAFVLPQLGYVNTPYGWIPRRALEQLQQNTGNNQFSLSSFINQIPNIWGSVNDFLDTWRDLFGNDSGNLILGNPGGDFSDYV